MRYESKHPLKLAAVISALSMSPLVMADPAAPVPPEPPKDLIIVRPDMSRTFTTAPDAFAFARVGEPLEQKMVKAAFLGVGVSNAPEVLTEQLKLPQGVGLVVEFVEKDSPAEKAGIQPRDLLHKLNEQLLINVQQLATLVRTFKPQESVKLTVIRKGEVITLDAVLVEKEMPELTWSAQQFEFTTTPHFPNLAAPELPHQLRIETDDEGEGRVKARIIRVMPNATSKITKVDDDGLRIELESRNGKKSLQIRNGDGKTVFEGPYNTDEEKEKLPAEFREKVKSVEDGIRLEEVPATAPTEPKADADDIFKPGPTT